MTTLLAVSNDHWGALAEACALHHNNVIVAVDHSGGLIRSLRLTLRGSIPLRAAGHMWLAQRSWPRNRPQSTNWFRNNSQLRLLAEQEKVEEIVLFRAGLIVSGKTIERCRVRNIHCADIVGFGGLASIYRALKAGAFEQKATLHRVTSKIDEGEILDTEPFRLAPGLAYDKNEALAYQAGLRLLNRVLAQTDPEGTRANG